MMSDPNDNPARSRRRQQRRSYALLILAAGMLAFGLAAGGLYYVLRPTTLRIAVGPAGSEDQKLVQLMAQTFARENSAVRLSLVTTEGAAESIALFTAGKADLAVARGDLNLPENAESVAILRKNVDRLGIFRQVQVAAGDREIGLAGGEQRDAFRRPFGRDQRQPHRAVFARERLRHQLDQFLVLAAGRSHRNPQRRRPQHVIEPAGGKAEGEHAGGKDQKRVAPPLLSPAGSCRIVVRV